MAPSTPSLSIAATIPNDEMVLEVAVNGGADWLLTFNERDFAGAERLGVRLNQFINVAVAEKVAALRTADFFRERARRANVEAALSFLDRLGNDEPLRAGDAIEPP